LAIAGPRRVSNRSIQELDLQLAGDQTGVGRLAQEGPDGLAALRGHSRRLEVIGVLTTHFGQLIRCKESDPASLDLLLGGEEFSHSANPGSQLGIDESVRVESEAAEQVGMAGDVQFGRPLQIRLVAWIYCSPSPARV
jgi:hypothetical protein